MIHLDIENTVVEMKNTPLRPKIRGHRKKDQWNSSIHNIQNIFTQECSNSMYGDSLNWSTKEKWKTLMELWGNIKTRTVIKHYCLREVGRGKTKQIWRSRQIFYIWQKQQTHRFPEPQIILHGWNMMKATRGSVSTKLLKSVTDKGRDYQKESWHEEQG